MRIFFYLLKLFVTITIHGFLFLRYWCNGGLKGTLNEHKEPPGAGHNKTGHHQMGPPRNLSDVFQTDLLGKDDNLHGGIAWVLAATIVLISINPVRRRLFDFFYRFHVLLGFAFFFFALIHYEGGQLIGFTIVPILLWVFDLYLRGRELYGSNSHYTNNELVSAVVLPPPMTGNNSDVSNSVIELQFKKGGDRSLRYEPGQFAFLCVPQVSLFEAHPFSISSAPGDAVTTFHIKVDGDWTKKLRNWIASNSGLPTIRMEGPYGRLSVPLLESKMYQNIILVSGGIGITPMISLLSHIKNQYQSSYLPSISSIKFIWILRVSTANVLLDCFRNTILDAKRVLQSNGVNTEILVHVTGSSLLANDALESGIEGALETHTGRPDLNRLFSDSARTATERY